MGTYQQCVERNKIKIGVGDQVNNNEEGKRDWRNKTERNFQINEIRIQVGGVGGTLTT